VRFQTKNIASYGQKVIVKKRMVLKSLALIVIIMTNSNLVTAELNVNYYKEGLIKLRKDYEENNKRISAEILNLSSEVNQKLVLKLQSAYCKEFKERIGLLNTTINEYEKSLKTGESEELHNQILLRSRELMSFSKLSLLVLANKIQVFNSADNEKIKNFLKTQ